MVLTPKDTEFDLGVVLTHTGSGPGLQVVPTPTGPVLGPVLELKVVPAQVDPWVGFRVVLTPTSPGVDDTSTDFPGRSGREERPLPCSRWVEGCDRESVDGGRSR